MDKVLNEILSELKEIKAIQLQIQKDQVSMKNDTQVLKSDITHLKDGQQDRNSLIKHTLTLQIENMLEIKQSLRSLQESNDVKHHSR
ncbi:hypothetical protein JOC95_003461 [Bacillus tianshenii]|uniref:Uncharacterized protein n=1 Tax=Sutcliffiella tianshenii TaxID=1463404 RepID=A0ABS2P4L6_9BACI|nr:hypothetical protein [Bacillus tianshenii]MBM7621572.1 hypothetical protein [Bacillus tianshenii]